MLSERSFRLQAPEDFDFWTTVWSSGWCGLAPFSYDEERRTLPVTPPIRLNRLLLRKGEERVLAYYWYQHSEGVYADLFRMKMSLLRRRIAAGGRRSEQNAFVRLSATFEGRRQEEAEATLETLTPAVVKAVEELLQDGAAAFRSEGGGTPPGKERESWESLR